MLDGTGRPVEQYNADHSGEGLVTLVNKLKQRTASEPALVAIGIEVAWGALVETLVEAGFAVFSINPKQVDRFRDRFTVAGAKDDAWDALVLASSLFTDRQSYRRVDIDSPELIRLRELSRFQDELKVELRRVTNHLWQQLHRYYPQMLAISPAADDRLVWDLLDAAPTPAAGAKITSLRILRILKANRIRKVSVYDVHAALRTAPLVLAPGAAEAACEHVQLLLPPGEATGGATSGGGQSHQAPANRHDRGERGNESATVRCRPGPIYPWYRPCCRRSSSDGSLQADPGAGLRGIALLRRHGPGYQAKWQEKNRRHASGLQSALAKRGVLLGDKQPLLR